ncbi:hypothetical protein [Clostridium sp.]|uniref:hypothetical protein n=1 Tax=Clostridium sp. TaxID=1506 RepID=UPI00258E0586|nr:hypothetical protein [Clostridium sp.]
MAKPSIFSNRYRRQMKKRRNRTVIIIVCAIVIIAAIVVLASGRLTNWTKNNANVKKVPVAQSDKKQSTAVKEDTSKSAEKPADNKESQKPVDKVFAVNMPDGKAINVIYDDSSNTRKITNIQNQDQDIEFNINPSSTVAILYEKSTQNMLLVNADGTSSNSASTSYKSTTGTTFNKDSIIKDKPGYIWQQSPKFIDDNNIAYISQLPWFDNRTSKFIWKYNIKDKTNINTNITGTNVQINNLTDKGLEIVTDNVTQYLKGDGSVTK